MPIYDYACPRCDEVTEVIHGIHDAGPRFCPACGAEGTMRKGITTSVVHFKGSGWAKKDRAANTSSGKARAAQSSGDASAAGGDSSGASEASPSPAAQAGPPQAGPAQAGPAPASTTDGGD